MNERGAEMKKDLGIGIVGLGMGRDLLYVNRDAASRFEVRGLCARTREKVQEAARRHSIGFCTAEYAALLERKDIHVIGIYTPDALHGQQCLQALEAGKHVVVTKPFTTNLGEALAIARLADKKGLKVLVGETCRFYTSFMAAKRLLDEGRLGDLVWVDAWYVHQISDSLFDITPWRLSEPQDFLYGGVCHPMDTVIWVLGEAEEVHCVATKSGLSPRYPLPENFLINVKMRSGKMARVAGSYGIMQPPYPMMGLALHGTRGSAVADFTDFETSSLKMRLSSEKTAGAQATEEARTIETGTRIEYSYPVDMEGA